MEENVLGVKGSVGEIIENNCDCDECSAYDGEVMYEPIKLEFEDFNEEEFFKGVHDMSRMAGQLTALKNIGLSWEDSVTLVMNERIMAHNIEIAKINAKSIEKQNINNEKNNL